MSILSSRWRHLWRNLPNLNFDLSNMFENNEYKDNHEIYTFTAKKKSLIIEGRSQQFIGRVDKFLQSHQGMGVKTFSVHFYLNKNHADHLDKWVDFAITSGAHDLSLRLQDQYALAGFDYESTTVLYDFPFQLFGGDRGSSIERLSLVFCAMRVPPNFDGFHTIKEIELIDVDVNEGQIEGLLSTCSVLESLSISWCEKLVNLRISNPSGRLKFLYIFLCEYLVGLEVNAKNLSTFEYEGQKVRFVFRDTLQLTRVYINFDEPHNTLKYVLSKHQDDMPMLKTLLLSDSDGDGSGMPINPSTFIHLKHLVLNILQGSLLWLFSFLSAAPFLEKFQLNVKFLSSKLKFSDGENIRRLHTSPYNHLKTIDINGFYSSTSQIEFARYMLNNAVALELMTICSRNRWYVGNFLWDTSDDVRPLRPKVRKKILARLHGQGPPAAKIVIF